MTEATNDRRLATLAAVLLALTAVRISALFLSRADLFFDEAQYWEWAQSLAWGYYSKPPMIAWLIAGTTAVCGDAEPCVRLSSPIIHAGTALLVFLIGRRLYDSRVGFWSGLVYATLPGVSVSAGIASTDVPLLFCWAFALYAFLRMRDGGDWVWSVLLGLAIGLGLFAKYAMALFVPCALLALWVLRKEGRTIPTLSAAAALLVAALVVSPNLLWNASHGFATFSHTADNANWGKSLVRPDKGLEFLGAQLGVFGPVLFAGLMVIIWRAARRTPLAVPDRLLLCFSLPVLLLFTAQAFLSRAHANWAATAYVAGAVLVTATMLREGAFRARWGSLLLHLALAALIPAGMAMAGRVALPEGLDPLARLTGWRSLGAVVAAEAERGRYGAVLADDRAIVAELIYYLRDTAVPILAWKEGDRPRDHYELTRPYGAGSPQPVLLVSLTPEITAIATRFEHVEALRPPPAQATAGGRQVYLFALRGFRGP